jgi:hypothetical protein
MWNSLGQFACPRDVVCIDISAAAQHDHEGEHVVGRLEVGRTTNR